MVDAAHPPVPVMCSCGSTKIWVRLPQVHSGQDAARTGVLAHAAAIGVQGESFERANLIAVACDLIPGMPGTCGTCGTAWAYVTRYSWLQAYPRGAGRDVARRRLLDTYPHGGWQGVPLPPPLTGQRYTISLAARAMRPHSLTCEIRVNDKHPGGSGLFIALGMDDFDDETMPAIAATLERHGPDTAVPVLDALWAQDVPWRDNLALVRAALT